MGAILSQNHWRSRGDGLGDPGPINQNASNDKKALFLHFHFLLASLRTTIHAYTSN